MMRNTPPKGGSCKSRIRWTKLAFLRLWGLVVDLPAHAQHQRTAAQLSEAEFVALANRCAPGAPSDTLLAIARTESNLNPNAISINRPKAAARRSGYRDQDLVFSKQPRDPRQAKSWLQWFARHNYTVSVGPTQVNPEIAPRFRLKPEQLLDPCTNVRVGSAILISAYTELAYEIGEGFSALNIALSVYNSGDPRTGFRNSYVANVYAQAPRRTPLLTSPTLRITGLVITPSTGAKAASLFPIRGQVASFENNYSQSDPNNTRNHMQEPDADSSNAQVVGKYKAKSATREANCLSPVGSAGAHLIRVRRTKALEREFPRPALQPCCATATADRLAAFVG